MSARNQYLQSRHTNEIIWPEDRADPEAVRLLKNIGTLFICPDDGGQEYVKPRRNAALLWKGDVILWAGSEGELPGNRDLPEPDESFDAEGRVVIPGLIDCHTHLAFGGWRPDEFELRSLGKSYEEIAAAGGGILSTVSATRDTSEQDLIRKSAGLLEEMVRLGVTTIECKSGYGLTLEDELKQLRVYRSLKNSFPIRMMSTFLGAHAIPPEYRDKRGKYVRLVTEEMIPAVTEAGLAEFCDVFVDAPAFTIEEGEVILEAGKKAGLIPKVHADQLTANGGAELAAKVGAVSADHLECISDRGITSMREAGTVAVSLPLATWYLRKEPLPARKLMEAGVPVAVSTDFNPGSAPSFHLPMAMHLACTLQYMSPAEVLKGATIYAARALGVNNVTGSVEPGKKADFVELDTESVNHWLYHFRPDAAARVWSEGACLVTRQRN